MTASTLEDAKAAVTPLLIKFAADVRRDANGPQGAALADLYDQCAERVQAAGDRDEIYAAVMTAVDGGEQ
jgi:hypothetical protein